MVLLCGRDTPPPLQRERGVMGRQELGILTTKQRFDYQEPPLLLSTPSGDVESGNSLLDLVQDTTMKDPQQAAEHATHRP